MESSNGVNIVIALIAAIGGGVIASFITSVLAPRLNEVFDFRSKRRTVLKQCLYKLLTLYAQLKLLDNKPLRDSVLETWFRPLVSEGYSELEIDALWKRLDAIIPNIREGQMTFAQFRKHSEESLELLINDISSIDPILAFNIRRRHTKISVNVGKEPDSTSENFKQQLDELLWSLQRDVLEKDLRAISQKLGIRAFIKTNWELRKWKQDSTKHQNQVMSLQYDKDMKPRIMKLLDELRETDGKSVD